MKKVLLYIWQLPQNLLGLVCRLFFKTEKTLEYKGKTIRVCSKTCGFSLGDTIYVRKWPTNKNLWDVVKHEYGHALQSKGYGWFYLLIIGLPSGAWNLIDRIITPIIGYEKSYKLYFNMPWEKGADKRGNVDRWNTL